ncbi:Lipid A biosynthesis myristoyltransferase [Aeromonas salmonicida]
MAAMSSHDPVFDTSFHARLLHPRWWGSWLALGFLCLLAWVPHGVRGRFANAVAPALLRLSKKQAYIAETNLKICFPELDAAGRRTLLLKAIRTGLKAFMGFGELTLRSASQKPHQGTGLGAYRSGAGRRAHHDTGRASHLGGGHDWPLPDR